MSQSGVWGGDVPDGFGEEYEREYSHVEYNPDCPIQMVIIKEKNPPTIPHNKWVSY